MRYDVIIANPPYGKIGNEITKAVIDNIDYGTFVNLLPANDYRRWHKEDKLYQYVDINSMRSVQDGFKDAVVTPLLCKINKDRALYISEEEFEIETYSDRSLTKYFYETRNRFHYVFENPDGGRHPDTWITGRTFIMCNRNISDGHLSYTKNSAPYKWNVEKSIDWKYLVEKHNTTRAAKKGIYEMNFFGITFNTNNEFENFTNFIYSSDGFRFMSKVLLAMHSDGYVLFNKFMPKVDWTRPQTVQTILNGYGYTPSEIEEVVADLANFKGMEE